jgi:Mn2+/Fe2+ NRAMP family transporter
MSAALFQFNDKLLRKAAGTLNLTPLDPMKALIWSAIINGVAAVPIMVIIILMASRKSVVGEFVLTRLLTVLGWLATAVVAAAAIGMFATWAS